MDLGLCRALFAACLEILDSLKDEAALRKRIEEAQQRLAPLDDSHAAVVRQQRHHDADTAR